MGAWGAGLRAGADGDRDIRRPAPVEFGNMTVIFAVGWFGYDLSAPTILLPALAIAAGGAMSVAARAPLPAVVPAATL